MRRVFGPSCTAVALLAMELASASPIAAQAKIERVIGPAGGVMVQRAGTGEERATAGMSLSPGDIVRADASAKVEIRCTTKGATTYFLPGAFRLFIDVPVNSLCTVNMLDGHADVVAEEPSNTAAGTIALASKGTQYSVDVSRDGRTVVCKVVVFEGVVFARGTDQATRQGTTVQWTGRSATTTRTSPQDIDRSAALYATFDVDAARTASTDTPADVSYDQLKALHYAVLANPTDTAKRVALAKRQMQYKVNDQAAYNLKRANVRTDSALRRYEIDPRAVRANPVMRDRIYKTAGTSVVRPDAGSASGRGASRVATRTGAATAAGSVYPRAAARPAPPASTTDSDLQLIASGKADEAVRNLEARVTAGSATSRDHYALAKAYDDRDAAKVREHATRAISLQVTDGKLSDAELDDVRDLLGRAG